jgi:hypothetical protein
VPWQSYPGHEPCPLPVPQELGYQWSAAASSSSGPGQAARKRRLLKQAGELLSADDFPGKIFDKGKLRLATLLHRAGVRDLGHVIESARLFHKYWALCGGRLRLPSSVEPERSAPVLSAVPETAAQGESMKGV